MPDQPDQPDELMPLTNGELDAMQARCDAATPGPWRLIGDSFDPPEWFVVTEDGCEVILGPTDAMPVNSNAEFIAHARTDTPRLIAEVRRLRAEADELFSALTGLEALLTAHEWGDGPARRAAQAAIVKAPKGTP